MYKEAVPRQKRYKKPQIKIFIVTRRKKNHIVEGRNNGHKGNKVS